MNFTQIHILITTLGPLDITYYENNTKIQIQKISLKMQEIITTFELSNIWINQQPAGYVKGFKAAIIQHNSLIRAEIVEAKLSLFSDQFDCFDLKVKYEDESYIFKGSPGLKVTGLRVLIKNKFNCADFEIYDVKTASQLNESYTLESCGITEHTELEIVSNIDLSLSDNQENNSENSPFEIGMSANSFVNFKVEKNLFFDNQAPLWRTIIRGLNLEGKCLNPGCDAYKKFVCVRLGMGEFRMREQKAKANCPHCESGKKLESIINCIFWDCMYTIEGVQECGIEIFPVEKQAPIDFSLSFAEATENHKTNIVNWKTLKITTSKVPEGPKVSEICKVPTNSSYFCVLL